MKTAIQSLPKFSGYPLQPAVKKQQQNFQHLTVVRKAEKQSLRPANSMACDPLQWDEAWFSNYE